jgi:predicted DNA-binding helix-hairpin-helix protein
MRFYGFAADELTTPDQPNLDLALDPQARLGAAAPRLLPR